MTPVILNHGTWSRETDWHKPGFPMWKMLADRGYTVLEFKWSGYCGGIPGPVIVPPSTAQILGFLQLWKSVGEKLTLFCQRLGLERPHVISHSHGLQGTMWSAAGTDFVAPQLFDTVLSLSGPVRPDMQAVRERAVANITKLVQVTDPISDWTIREGELFGHALAHLGWNYKLPEAHVNIDAPGHGHSGLTLDISAWTDLGLLDYFPDVR